MLGDLLEALLGIGLLVHIGMELAGLLLEGLLDVLSGGVFINAQNGVVVFIVHSCHMAKTPLFMGYIQWETLYPDPACDKRGGCVLHIHVQNVSTAFTSGDAIGRSTGTRA